VFFFDVRPRESSATDQLWCAASPDSSSPPACRPPPQGRDWLAGRKSPPTPISSAGTGAAGRLRRAHQGVTAAGMDLNPSAPCAGKFFWRCTRRISRRGRCHRLRTLRRPAGNYQVRLPDVLPRTRFARADDRRAAAEFGQSQCRARIPRKSRVAHRPVLARQLFADDWQKAILSSPGKMVNSLSVSRTVTTARALTRSPARGDLAKLSGADV